MWDQIQQINLTIMMRLDPEEIEFASYLLSLGNGTAKVHPEIGQDVIQIPKQYMVYSSDELIDKVFPQITEGYADKYFVSQRAILTRMHENVDELNEAIVDKFPGEGKTYLCADSAVEEDLHNTYPTDFLNSITLSGMPSHSMTLKVGAPVILL